MSITDPEYYRRGDIQLSLVASEWGLGYHLGLILKYTCRAGLKDPDPLVDLRKAVAASDLATQAIQHGHDICNEAIPQHYWPDEISERWSLGSRRKDVLKILSYLGSKSSPESRLMRLTILMSSINDIRKLLQEEINEFESD